MVGVYYVLDCYKGLYGRRRGSHIHTYTHTRTHARTAPEHHCQSGSVRDGQALCVSVLVCVCVIHAVHRRRGSHIHTPTHTNTRTTLDHQSLPLGCRSGRLPLMVSGWSSHSVMRCSCSAPLCAWPFRQPGLSFHATTYPDSASLPCQQAHNACPRIV